MTVFSCKPQMTKKAPMNDDCIKFTEQLRSFPWFHEYIELITGYRDKKIDIETLLDNMEQFLEGYPDLIEGFNKILPPAYNINKSETGRTSTGKRLRKAHSRIAGEVLSQNEDIVAEIMARLPVKSLLRFRCVCKSWLALIAQPHLVRMHMARHEGLDCRHILLTFKPPRSMTLKSIVDLDQVQVTRNKRERNLVKLKDLVSSFPFDGDVGYISNWSKRAVGSCNGLVCLAFRKRLYVIWNPSTRQYNLLPKPGNIYQTDNPTTVLPQYCGFGCDDTTGDYKVVRGYFRGRRGKPLVQVFSLKSGSWKKYSCLENVNLIGQGRLLNGVLYWFEFDSDRRKKNTKVKIRPFSLAEEKFQEAIPLPFGYPCKGDHEVEGDGILISRNSLFVYSIEVRRGTTGTVARPRLWKLRPAEDREMYGVEESWNEVSGINVDAACVSQGYRRKRFLKPLCILDNGDIVAYTDNVQRDGPLLALFKPKDNAISNVVKFNKPYRSRGEGIIYRESLVSPVTGGVQDVKLAS